MKKTTAIVEIVFANMDVQLTFSPHSYNINISVIFLFDWGFAQFTYE